MIRRTFIAIKIYPTEELLRRICFLKHHLSEENINWIKSDHFHLTLRFIGNTQEYEFPNISKSIKKIALNKKPFVLSVSGIKTFGSRYSPKVIWAGVEPMEKLKQLALEIDSELEYLEFSRDRQNFVPHLTLARIRKLQNKDYFFNVLDKMDNKLILEEEITSVIFYESILKQRGAVYNILEEVKLGE
jgi:2'-5' RNA ligase